MTTIFKRRTALVFAALCFVGDARAQDAAMPIATSPESTTPLKIGVKMPAVTLLDSAGATYKLTESLANGPAVLIFYRGGWCPYCNAQLREMNEIEPELLKLGFRIFAISPDAPADLAKASDKHRLKFKMLSDPAMTATSALGLAYRVDDKTVAQYKRYDIDLSRSKNLLPVPAVYLVGRDGVVDFSYVNPDYRTRVPGKLVLAAAQIYAKAK